MFRWIELISLVVVIWHGWWDMGCQSIYIFFVVRSKNLICSFILNYICSKYNLYLWIKDDLKGSRILLWNFMLRYFIIKYLRRSYCFTKIFVAVFGILAPSMLQNILKFYGWWDLRFEFKLIYLLLYIYTLLLEELDTKRLILVGYIPALVS